MFTAGDDGVECTPRREREGILEDEESSVNSRDKRRGYIPFFREQINY
jgi:hypothetical protein